MKRYASGGLLAAVLGEPIQGSTVDTLSVQQKLQRRHGLLCLTLETVAEMEYRRAALPGLYGGITMGLENRSGSGSAGAMKSRSVMSANFRRTLPGAPDGNYVVIRFAASFEHKAGATETVTPMEDPDGQWRVSGYYIR